MPQIRILSLRPRHTRRVDGANSRNRPPAVRFLTCTFGEWKAGRIIEKGTLCKMARGRMVRWLAENNVTAAGDIREFHELGYRYHAGCSGENRFVFVKEDR